MNFKLDRGTHPEFCTAGSKGVDLKFIYDLYLISELL